MTAALAGKLVISINALFIVEVLPVLLKLEGLGVSTVNSLPYGGSSNR